MKLSDIAEFVTDKISSSSISLDSYVTTDSLLQNKRGREQAQNLPPMQCALTNYKKGDVLVANIRPYLKKVWFADSEGGCSSDVLVFRAKNGHYPSFLYAILMQDAFFDYAMLGAKGSKMPRGDKNQIMRYELPTFTSVEEENIGNIMVDIISKINVNRQINDNLEAMAKQLYDYWFVQFDFPNEEGKPYKSSGGAMVWNDKLKREIPQGWSGVSLKDLALTSRNAITPVENEVYQHFNIPSFDACGSYSLDNGSDIKSDKFVLQKGQLLVSKLNPWFNRVVWVPKGTNMIGSTEFVVLNPNNESESGYIYSVIKSPKFIAYCSQAATGTSHSQRRVSPDVLMAFKVGYEQGVVQKYGCLIEKIQKQQAELLSEIAILTKQRDELLPLLMNGQATVNYHLSSFLPHTIAHSFALKAAFTTKSSEVFKEDRAM